MKRAVVAGYAVTTLVLLVALVQVLRSGTDPANTSAPGYMPLAWVATAILIVVVVVAAMIRGISVRTSPWLPVVVGAVSLVVSLIPWWAVASGAADLGSAIYRGLRVPQGITQFWDLLLPLQSLDCAAVGIDVYAENNGCLQDPTIYGPGVLWLGALPFDLFSARNVTGFGLAFMVISSLLLAWLARRSTGVGQIALLIAAVGGPWLLLLERGNIDAALLWGAGLVVILAARWDRLWSWSLAAGVLWLLGTWKYYPFAMGLMLVPALRLRRGWLVLVGFAVASAGFALATWQTFQFSAQSNRNMIDYGDFVVLGRVPVVARMLGTVVGQDGLQLGDVLLYVLALVALAWGVAAGLAWRRTPQHPAMLAIAGSALFLASVLYAGFGWGYKATFLLLAIPLVSRLAGARAPALAASGIAILALIAIDAVVVWNTVLATLAGIVAASFVLGLSATVFVRLLRRPRSAGVSVAGPSAG